MYRPELCGPSIALAKHPALRSNRHGVSVGARSVSLEKNQHREIEQTGTELRLAAKAFWRSCSWIYPDQSAENSMEMGGGVV